MKIEEGLAGVTRLFIDTAPVIYWVERHPLFHPRIQPIFAKLDSGELAAVTSPITLAETLVGTYKAGSAEIAQRFRDQIVRGMGTQFRLIDEAIADQSAELRARYNLTLTDALQVAVAIAADCQAFLTNDHGLKRVTELRILVVGELELN